MSQQDLIRAAKSYDLALQRPPSIGPRPSHLPEKDILNAVDGPHGIYADPDALRRPGMIKRTPNDPSWYQGGLWNDSSPSTFPASGSCPGMTSASRPTSPHTTTSAKPPARNRQSAVRHHRALAHCSYKGATEDTIVGERDMGDARLDYDAFTYGWFDHFLKGRGQRLARQDPQVRYFTMGLNKWQTADTWPPEGAQPMTYLSLQRRQSQLLQWRRRS